MKYYHLMIKYKIIYIKCVKKKAEAPVYVYYPWWFRIIKL